MSSREPSSRPSAHAILALLGQHVLELPEDFAADADLFAAGLDSMGIMQLLLHIEEEYAVQIPMAEVTHDNFSTTAAIADLIAAKIADAAARP